MMNSINRILFVCVLLALAGCNSAQETFAKAYAEDQKGNEEKALQLYEETLGWDSDYVAAHNNRALIFIKRKDFASAEKEIDAALKVNPDSGIAYLNRGLLLEAKDSPRDALVAYKKAAELEPKLLQAQFNAGNLSLRLGNAGEAVKYLEKANEIQSDDQTFRALSQAYLRSGNYQSAIQAFEYMLGKNPGDEEAFLGQISAQRGAGNFDQAITLTKQLNQRRPGCAPCQNMLGSLYAESKKYDDAIGTFEQVAKSNPKDSASRYQLGFLYLIAGKTPSAISNLEDYLKIREGQSDEQINRAKKILAALNKTKKQS